MRIIRKSNGIPLLIAYFILACPLRLFSFSTDDPASRLNSDQILQTLKQYTEEEKWEAILTLLGSNPEQNSDFDFYHGIALAKLGKFDEASEFLRRGKKEAPQEKKFALELAGIAFKQNELSVAKAYLTEALRLDSKDAYANEFLGTIFILQENTEAALKYWNRIEKPYLQNVYSDPDPGVDPILLDHAFEFSRAQVLYLKDLQKTTARIDLLEAFQTYRFDLSSQPQSSGFDLIFRSSQRTGISRSWIGSLLTSFRDLPYQTIHAEFYDIHGSAVNSRSLLRWDAQKRRIFHETSGIFKNEPDWRYRINVDARKETWDLNANLRTSRAQTSEDLKLQVVRSGFSVEGLVGRRSNWRSGIELAYRDLSHLPLQASESSNFEQGFAAKFHSGLRYTLLDFPEDHLRANLQMQVELARLYSENGGAYSRVRSDLGLQWSPGDQNPTYRFSSNVHAAVATKRTPVDELFSLGMQRDEPLILHAHSATREGKKGFGPIGKQYFLFNMEMGRKIYDHPLLQIWTGPVLDIGKTHDPEHIFQDPGWLLDVGIQCKFRTIGGVSFTLSYARDLKSGGGLFYTTSGP